MQVPRLGFLELVEMLAEGDVEAVQKLDTVTEDLIDRALGRQQARHRFPCLGSPTVGLLASLPVAMQHGHAYPPWL